MDFLLRIALVLLIHYAWTWYQKIQRSRKPQDFLILDYQETSQPQTDPWRWRRPDSSVGIGSRGDRGLYLDDSDLASHLVLPYAFGLDKLFLNFIGYLFLLFALFFIFSSVLFPVELWAILALMLALGGIIWLCFEAVRQIRRIDLYPDQVHFVFLYGFWFRRKYRLSAHSQLKFMTIEQSVQDPREIDQIAYAYTMFVERITAKGTAKTEAFDLNCTPSQVSWIVGGLNQWNREALKLREG
ncbi:MAG: hypothetical protein ACO34J_12180 [Prochlorothrix sp.]